MNKKKIIAWALFLFWLSLIFFFSSQNGNDSSELSNGFLKTLENIIHIPLTNDFFSLLIRKTAHFLEYFLLALVTCNLVKQYRMLKGKEYLLIFLFCVFYAFSDEFHQLFVGGRASKALDVFIDSLGSLLGVIVYFLIIKFRESKKL